MSGMSFDSSLSHAREADGDLREASVAITSTAINWRALQRHSCLELAKKKKQKQNQEERGRAREKEKLKKCQKQSALFCRPIALALPIFFIMTLMFFLILHYRILAGAY